MPRDTAGAIVCGAGLAGISAAYHLAVRHGMRSVTLVDERAPLTLTSDKSTECYRNWWPPLAAAGIDLPHVSSAMVRLVDRSIELMEELAHESDNVFRLNRRGYLYMTADPALSVAMRREAEDISRLGAGPLRCHTGAASEPSYEPAPAEGFTSPPAGAVSGADFITDRSVLSTYFPYLSGKVVAALHVRRAGWLSAQQLGMYLLEQAREHGVELLRARLTGVETHGGRVTGVRLDTAGGQVRVSTPCFVNAAGPLCGEVAAMMGISLPVYAELHAKVAFHDTLGAVPRDAPLLIWNDPQRLLWSEDEAAAWREAPDTCWMLDELPGGAHTRPDGPASSDVALMLWAYHTPPAEITWPPEFDPCYAEVALRGLATMLPSLSRYIGHLPRPSIDGGYYLKTRENRPLIGPLPVPGAYVVAALSGFGLMSACAAGELLAAHVAGGELPEYAPAFRLERYQDPAYLALLEAQDSQGQL